MSGRVKSTWSDEAMIATLRRLCAEELSDAQIAAQLGVSKNSVIGARHRLGIALNTKRAIGLRTPGPRPVRHRAPPAARVLVPKRRAVPTLVPPAYPPPGPDEPDFRPTNRPVSIKNLRRRYGQCRAVLDHARDELGLRMYCGAPSGAEPWCPYHRALFYAAPAAATIKQKQSEPA